MVPQTVGFSMAFPIDNDPVQATGCTLTGGTSRCQPQARSVFFHGDATTRRFRSDFLHGDQRKNHCLSHHSMVDLTMKNKD